MIKIIAITFIIACILLISSTQVFGDDDNGRQLRGGKTKNPSFSGTRKPSADRTKNPSFNGTKNPSSRGGPKGKPECKELADKLCTDCATLTGEEKKTCMDGCIQNNFDAFNTTGCIPPKKDDGCKTLIDSLCSSCETSSDKKSCMKTCVSENKEQLDAAGCKPPQPDPKI